MYLAKKTGFVGKSLKWNVGDKGSKIVFFSYSQNSSKEFLKSDRPCIELTDSIVGSAPMELTIACEPSQVIPPGRYPLIKASKINSTQFKVGFYRSTNLFEANNEAAHLLHLELDETTVWLVVDE